MLERVCPSTGEKKQKSKKKGKKWREKKKKKVGRSLKEMPAKQAEGWNGRKREKKPFIKKNAIVINRKSWRVSFLPFFL